MFDKEEDAPKAWLENLTEGEYEAYKDARTVQKERAGQRICGRPEGL